MSALKPEHVGYWEIKIVEDRLVLTSNKRTLVMHPPQDEDIYVFKLRIMRRVWMSEDIRIRRRLTNLHRQLMESPRE